jgi:diacylglycerol kinase family enzyme
MKPEDLAENIKTVLSHSPAFPGKSLVVDIIANPKAGGFKRHNFASKRLKELKVLTDKAITLAARVDPVLVRLHLTERCGHAAAIAQRILDKSESNGKDSCHLIFTAGGDGTSLETAERMVRLPESEKDNFGLLRLPFGTGNDGSEGRDLFTALGRFLAPVKFERRPAIHILPSQEGGQTPLYAFNIASIGLDAYVADMTNRLKSRFPGDSYKFWVNIGTLFYDKVYKVTPMRLKAWNEAGEMTRDDERERLLVAMGASGHRQYGSNKKILPGSDNCISVSQTGFLRKLLAKGPIENGHHEGVPEVQHFDARKIEIDFRDTILLQCDGETHMLAGCDFPMTMDLMGSAYNIVSPA